VLKAALLALVAANLLFFGFTRGWFDGMFEGIDSRGDREPGRLAKQVRPGGIVLLPVPVKASAPESVAGSCLEAGPIAAADAPAAEAALRATLPDGGWTDIRTDAPAGTPAFATHVYRVANADAATAARLGTLKLDAAGRGFSACGRSMPAR